MTWGKYVWPTWLGLVIASFLAFEITGLATNTRNTLTDWVRYALNIRPGERIGQWSAADLLLFAVYVTVFMAWLPWHFWFDKFS